MVMVIGVDPSFTCTGVCVWVDRRVQTFSVRTNSDDPRVVRQTHIAARVMEQVDVMHLSYPSVEVMGMVEAVYQGGFGRTSLDLAGLHDVLVYEFHRRGIRVGTPSPRALKKFATQDGNANKRRMVNEARIALGITVGNDNEADALWLAAMGVVAMGGQVINSWPHAPDHPLAVKDQQSRADTLAKVTWIGGEPGPLLKGM